MFGIKKLILFSILLFGPVVIAQQLPQFTQYMYNTISINPAYAGSRQTLNVTLLHRNQWAGLEGNPRTSTLSIHSPMRNDRVGLGISYINDRLGDENFNFVYGDFSYTVPLGEELNMSFGLKAGFTSYHLSNPDPNDPFFNAQFNGWNPNFGTGFYIGTNRWYAGISTPRILNTDLNQGEFKALERNSYYAIGGVVVDINENIKFKPTVIGKFTNGAPATYDFTASFLFDEKLWLGVSYRINDASNFGALLDYQISKNFRLGYAYDLPTSSVRPYTGGTHELIVIYELIKKSWRGIKSPRYF